MPRYAQQETTPRKQRPKTEDRRQLKSEIIEDLVDFVVAGRGGGRALMGDVFEKTTEKLNLMAIKADNSNGMRNILSTGKGFSSPPRDMINRVQKSSSMYSFLRMHTSRTMDEETFCLQSMVSDTKAWTRKIIEAQKNTFENSQAAKLNTRLNDSDKLDDAEYARNPASRQPETPEEAIQYLYYAVGLFDGEEAWTEWARDALAETFPLVGQLSYAKAKTVYSRKMQNGEYK